MYGNKEHYENSDSYGYVFAHKRGKTLHVLAAPRVGPMYPQPTPERALEVAMARLTPSPDRPVHFDVLDPSRIRLRPWDWRCNLHYSGQDGWVFKLYRVRITTTIERVKILPTK
jgi:hypothetical protein